MAHRREKLMDSNWSYKDLNQIHSDDPCSLKSYLAGWQVYFWNVYSLTSRWFACRMPLNSTVVWTRNLWGMQRMICFNLNLNIFRKWLSLVVCLPVYAHFNLLLFSPPLFLWPLAPLDVVHSFLSVPFQYISPLLSKLRWCLSALKFWTSLQLSLTNSSPTTTTQQIKRTLGGKWNVRWLCIIL